MTQSRIDRAIAALEALVGFDTVSRHSNLHLIEWIEGALDTHNVPYTRFQNADGTKTNLLARIGPDVPGGIALSGHTDVVPVDGQDWDQSPFQLTKTAANRLVGRGTSDMKGFIALCMAMLPEFTAAPLKKPIFFAFSYDEEVGCTGCLDMVHHMGTLNARPLAVLVGEPTEMALVDAHKGIRTFTVTVTGLEAHSSRTHEGVNAIFFGARLLTFIEDEAHKLQKLGDPLDGADSRFDPPYTSLHVGVLQGGTALNIIPHKCTFTYEYRDLPGADIETVQQAISDVAARLAQQMQHKAPDATDVGITITPGHQVPPLQAGQGGDQALQTFLRLAQANETQAVSYGTEAGHFQAQDIPTFVCGPGSIAQAHKPNEFVEISQLELGLDMLARLMDELAV
ncbi:MAG: acetylornithine deacetylase [Alphaproteobacteria bacterium]